MEGKIRDLPRILRPREKLIKYGYGKLSNSELLAILLRTGRKGENVLKLAQRVLKKFGGTKLSKQGFKELRGCPGLGPTKACEIIASFELSKRLLKGKKSKILLNPKDVWEDLRDVRDRKKEHFIVFYLDSRNQEIKKEIISIGSINANLVHPREVFEPAVKGLAAQIILSHNHPSGDTEPSEDDSVVTKRLVKAGDILGIEVLDHIIVSKGGFFSFKENKLL